MTIIVKIGEAKTRLSELFVRVEVGEEVVIQRGNEPISRITTLAPKPDVTAAIADQRALRAKARPVTTEEILEWRDEDRRYL